MSKKLNILLVAYSFSPDKRVGALRASYWYRNLPSKLNCDVHVITANEKSSGENVHFVPTSGKSVLSKFIKDPGLVWKKNIKSFLNAQENIRPDIVIITGGPFMQFGLTKWFKSKYSAKVILDYRDPFATNPGFNNSKLTIAVKKYFERSFNKQADALVTVNKYCANIIELFHEKKNSIIQNGFDESVKVDFKAPDFSNGISFVYTGKLYFEPQTFLSSIENTSHSLGYCGSDGDQLNKGIYIDHGLVPYEKALKTVAHSDVGLIQTAGEDHLSTTKIFDYIRCKRPIFIISNKYIERGSIQEELKDYPNVFWAKNSETDIKRALTQIMNHNYIEPDDELINEYSRGNQMEKLVELIKELDEVV